MDGMKEKIAYHSRRLMDWAQATYEQSWKKYAKIVTSKQWAKFISRSITALIQLIILAEEDISDDEIREEITMIFDVATHTINNERIFNYERFIGKITVN